MQVCGTIPLWPVGSRSLLLRKLGRVFKVLLAFYLSKQIWTLWTFEIFTKALARVHASPQKWLLKWCLQFNAMQCNVMQCTIFEDSFAKLWLHYQFTYSWLKDSAYSVCFKIAYYRILYSTLPTFLLALYLFHSMFEISFENRS